MFAFSDACERNKDPILQILRTALSVSKTVLEIGSGTGQHAVYFARALPHLIWQPTDVQQNLPGLEERLRLEGSDNIRAPLVLDVRDDPWPVSAVDAVYSANTLHIMNWSAVQKFFVGVGKVLAPQGALCVYGPFRYGGKYTSDSNAAFDKHLKMRDTGSGIRDAEAVDSLASAQGLALEADYRMPANNQTRIWRKAKS
jgi:cyclopropane fatty-acyl-phospholipid synthase-like methyltransferase